MGRDAISRDTRARAISHNYLDLTTDGPLEDWVSQLVSVGATLVEIRQDPATFANPDTWAVLQPLSRFVFGTRAANLLRVSGERIKQAQ